jgi:hypothetical protein
MSALKTTGTVSGIAHRHTLNFDVTDDDTGAIRSFYADGTHARTPVSEGQEHTTVYWDSDDRGPRYRAQEIYPLGWPQP